MPPQIGKKIHPFQITHIFWTYSIIFSRDQIDLTCEILKRILGTIPIGHALNRYEDLFLEGLIHPENRVKELIFHEVCRFLIDNQLKIVDNNVTLS